MKNLLTALTLIILTVLSTNAHASFGNNTEFCMERKEFVAWTKTDREIVSRGLAKIVLGAELSGFVVDGLVEIVHDKDGKWSIWLSRPIGATCLVLSGENFENNLGKTY